LIQYAKKSCQYASDLSIPDVWVFGVRDG
jgi:hypothetical protein